MIFQEVKWLYTYKLWCRKNFVVYSESDDYIFALHDEMMKIICLQQCI